jgi:NADH-quinone oxidoreductase subunit E
MAVRRLAADEIQPKSFTLSADAEAWAQAQIAKYPEGRQASAVVPLLWKVQGDCGGWLPQKAIEAVAERLGMPYIRVLEVATFYTMFNLEPVGRHFIQCCGTTPCALRGANDLMDMLRARVGEQRHVTADGNFSWLEVECLGACTNAPMVQINNDYYEDLTPEILSRIMDELAAGGQPKNGPQQGRRASEPLGDSVTLVDPSLYDGSMIGAWRKRFEEPAPAAEANAKAEGERATQQAATNPKPAKPDAGRVVERPVGDTPAVRAAAGEKPISDDKQAAASEPSRTTVAEGVPASETVAPPRTGKSYVNTPVKPEDGRTVADAPASPDSASVQKSGTEKTSGS